MTKNDEQSLVVDVKTAAEILRYSQATVRKLIHDGTLPAAQPSGRSYRILRSNVEKLLGTNAEPIAL